MLSAVEQSRLNVSRATEAGTKSRLGQFFTPAPTAQFMAGLFCQSSDDTCRLLDAGAGVGSLSAAFLERCASGGLHYRRIELDAFEIDERLHPILNRTLNGCGEHPGFVATVRGDDFIEAAVCSLCGDFFTDPLPKYTHAIMNPPYRKIRGNSSHRAALRRVGIETVNLYSAFVALALCLLESGSQLVAVIPRSFCNGPYYRSFRQFVLNRAAIRHMHLFASRNRAFRDDAVLQENVIVMLERGGEQDDVTITTSTDDSFADMATHTHPFNRIVFPSDPEQFVHVPTSTKRSAIEQSGAVRYSLEELGIKVSTGPVVDFRLKEHLCGMPEPDTVPLLYPGHFKGSTIQWPIPSLKKPNAIRRNMETERWLYPNGCYCVVRRFSAKEEKRRVVASAVESASFPEADMAWIRESSECLSREQARHAEGAGLRIGRIPQYDRRR